MTLLTLITLHRFRK